MLRLSLVVGLALLVIAGSTFAAEKPNFVVINIDDLGYGDIGPYGSKTNDTPNLNQMAAEGRKLTSFYAAPVCSPSRASLMTGCYPKRALPIPHVLFPAYDHGLSPDEITIAELLKKEGYTTGIIGKWHLGDQPEMLPTRQGFDYYYGLPYSNDMGPASDGVKTNFGVKLPKPNNKRKGQPPLPLMRNETVLKRVLQADQEAIVKNYTDEAVAFIKQHQKGPFFLYLPHSAVHYPLYPSEAFRGKSKNGLFGDWVQEVDWSVGEVLKTIRELGIEKNTLVIFTSDNGGQPRFGANNGPLRGGKGSTFEGGVRVPTIVWQPGAIPAGTETNLMAGMMDVLPTLVGRAGGETPSDRTLDGVDIWPIMVGEPETPPRDTFYYYRGFNLECVRVGDWKLRLGKDELYLLSTDIGEENDVSKLHPEQVEALRKVAAKMEGDLGLKEIGPGCRPLGRVKNARPLIDHDGKVRPGFEVK